MKENHSAGDARQQIPEIVATLYMCELVSQDMRKLGRIESRQDFRGK
jgi:hypothetical protein